MPELNTGLLYMLAFAMVLIAACVFAMAWCAIRSQRMLMHFHGAGRSMADHELRMAELKVKEKEAELKVREMNMSERRVPSGATRTVVSAQHG